MRGSFPPKVAFARIPANAPTAKPRRMRVWRGMLRNRALVLAGSREKFFAGFVDDLCNHGRLTTRFRRTDGQSNLRTGLQGFFRPDLAPTGTDHIRRIRNNFRMPMLDCTLVVHSVEQYKRV